VYAHIHETSTADTPMEQFVNFMHVLEYQLSLA